MIKTIIFLLLSSVMSFNLWAADSLSADALYGKIRERFPELDLPEAIPTIVHVIDEDGLIDAVGNVSGHKVICVSGTIVLAGYLSLGITSGNRITIVGVTNAGEFKYATITGKGITSISAGQVDIANLYLTNIERNIGAFGNAISLEGITGEHRITSVTIDNCNSTADNSYSPARGGAIYVNLATGSTKPSVLICNTTIGENCVATYTTGAPLYVSNAKTLSLINCTIAASSSKVGNLQIDKKNVYWLSSSAPTVVKNVLIDTDPTATVVEQSYKVESNLVWVEDEANLPHYEIATTSTALNTGNAVDSLELKYDALGNLRNDGNGTDFGAVEMQVSAEVAFPDDLVILPSGQRQVYFGWTPIGTAKYIKAQISTDDGENWADISEDELVRRDEKSGEPTVKNWQSIRYIGASPGKTAKYRLLASAADEQWISSKEVQITNPSATKYYHSRPESNKKIYLDFDGYVDDYKGNVTSMQINIPDFAQRKYLETPKFVYTGYASFSDSAPYSTEKAIYDIWRMVAEDFMMFDVDVTTEEPDYDGLVKSSADDDTYGKRVIFDYAPNGRWYAGSGGISGLGAFGFRADRPAYIFGSNSRRNLACQATHETSHTLGLAHDGGYIYLPNVYAEDGTLVAMFVKDDYYTGQDVQADYKFTTWYPVMGGVPLPSSNNGKWVDLDYYDFINQFSNGNYDGATNKGDDDFAVMLGLVAGSREQAELDSVIVFPGKLYPDGRDSCEVRNLTLAKDDAGDTIAEAKGLVANGETSLSTTGVIGKHIEGTEVVDDVDVFAVAVTGAGTITAKVVPGYLGEIEGASLDAKVELLSASGDVLATSEVVKDGSADFREAGVSFECEAKGKYFIRVSGTNHQIMLKVAPEGYEVPTGGWNANAKDNYGSVGPYKLTLDLDGAEFTTPSDGRSKALRIIVR